jgi:hypothetical protein
MKAPHKLALAGATLAFAVAPGVALANGSQQSAEKQCRQERTSMGAKAFAELYGTNKNGRNAFGKCVSHRTRQDQSDQANAQSNASKQCRAERQSDPAAFKAKYGTNKNGNNAFGKCVSTTARQDANRQEAQQTQAETNAAKQCRTEQQSDPAGFKSKYGTNHTGRNAFGKCVSSKAKAQGSGTSS